MVFCLNAQQNHLAMCYVRVANVVIGQDITHNPLPAKISYVNFHPLVRITTCDQVVEITHIC